MIYDIILFASKIGGSLPSLWSSLTFSFPAKQNNTLLNYERSSAGFNQFKIMKLTKKDRKKIVKDYLGYVPLTFTKLDLEKEQKKKDKEILIAYKVISKIIKRKFKR